MSKTTRIVTFSFALAAAGIALAVLLTRCWPPIDVTYEVTSEDARVADVNYWDVADPYVYWLEPDRRLVHLKGTKLPFRKTVRFPSGEFSTNVGAVVGANKSVRCAVYFHGELVAKQGELSSCLVNANRRYEN